MLKIVEEIEIHATAERVFEIMTDFESYASWNPWVTEAHGSSAREGDELWVIADLGRFRQKVRHRILVHRPNVEFRWCDVGWFTALAYGQRARFVEPTPRGVRYRVELMVSGVGAGLVDLVLGKALRRGLEAETAALKARAESIVAGPPMRVAV